MPKIWARACPVSEFQTVFSLRLIFRHPTYASEVRQLAENLDQFDFVPKSVSPKAAGQVTELGYVAYHGSLALEELMGDDLTELHQEMGEWHNGATRGKGFVQQ